MLIHGNGMMIQDFLVSGIVDDLAKRYRVIIIDRPGYGYSDRPRGLWTPRAHATLFQKALQQIGVTQAVVLGHSWGALVAVALALQAPQIAYFNAIDPTCRSMGAMAISLIEEPHAGKVQLAQGQEYPNFTTLNSRSRCNTRRLPATQVLYTAAPGYVGSDEFALEVVGPLGAARRIRYRIAVR